MTGVLNSLLQITAYSAILFAAILLFQRLLRRRISAALNYAVWALLLLRLIVPVTIDSEWHLFTMPQQAAQTMQTQEPIAADTSDISATPSSEMPLSDISETPAQITDRKASDENFNPQSPSYSKPTDWQTVAVLVWAAGAIGFLSYTSVQWLRLSRRINRDCTHTPDFVLHTVRAEKEALCIRRNIRVSVQNWLVSPALSASLRPVLLLPAAFIQHSDALAFGIRHELTHYQRKDHLISLLLLLLRCVYWFNPIVWLAFRRIQTDMETACDAAVTTRMAQPERTRYIHTMIDIGRSAKPLYALGMGAGNGRKALEKRVRGIFMTKRTGLPARMAAGLLAMLLLAACFTTACQPTPEKAVVVNKNEGVLEAAVAAAPAPPTGYDAPETLKMDPFLVGNELTVTVDAAVDIPDTDTFPVYAFVPAVYTQEQIDAVVDYFYKGQTLYNKGGEWTKSEIEQKIVELKKIKQEILDGATNKSGSPKYDMSAEDVQEDINLLEQDALSAPESVDTSAWDGTFSTREHGDVVFKGFNVAPDLTEGDSRYFTAAVYDKLNSSTLMLINGTRYYPSTNQPPDTQAKGIQTTPAQAIEIARDMLDTCGFDFMDPVGAYAGDVVDSGEVVRNDLSGGYAVKCVRRVGDFHVTSAENGVTVNMARSNLTSEEMQAAYAHQWDPEVLTIYVDDTGITAVEWSSYGEIGATLSENVTLLPFDELDTYIENGITARYAWNDETMGGAERKRDINVSRIELSMARVQVKDHPMDWQLVPVFEIFGTISTWPEGETTAASDDIWVHDCLGYGTGLHSGSLLTINAVDGSAITGYWSYP